MATIVCSSYLKSKVDDFKSLIALLGESFEDASILGCDSNGKNYTVNKTDMSISEHAQKERGFVVRVLKDGRYFEYSFNDWTDAEAICAEVVKAYEEDEALLSAEGFTHFDSLAVETEEMDKEKTTTVEKTSAELSDSEVMTILEEKKKEMMAKDPRIVNMDIRVSNVTISKVFVSKVKTLVQGYMYTELNSSVTIFDGKKMKSGRSGKSGLMGLEILEYLEQVTKTAYDEAVVMLETTPLVPGFYDVVVSPSVAGVIAHEAFGHGLEMDMFVKNRALGAEYVGKTVASPITTMMDGALDVDHVGSYLFDDEGNLGTSTYLIKDGTLITGISDSASAQRLHLPPTGNGRRESFERKAYARMTNTYFVPGNDQLEDMIASIEDGYLLEGMSGGMEDPKHWGMTVSCTLAREVKNGKLTGKVHAPVLITGYVPDLLGSISMVSGDMDRNTGMCGKGYKEHVKVSCGGPYIKMRVRLG